MGPIALFDKSFLQSLSGAEALWFDQFFLCNTAPPFLIETLADLHKKVRPDRTPEDEVRIIADKSPEFGAPGINTFHRTTFIGSLLGHDVPMNGQVLISRGKPVQVDGKTSVVFDESPEAKAFQRWQRGQFREIEKGIAKVWRAALETRPGLDSAREFIAKLHLETESCKSLPELKTRIDAIVEGEASASALLNAALGLQDVGGKNAATARQRLQGCKYIPIRWFAPYAAYILSVDLLFYSAMLRGFIAAERASNKTDFSYLYYLPFCQMFVSSDGIHRRVAPLFLREDQSFVWGPDLKKALGQINAHFAALPEEEKAKGTYAFAVRPPKNVGTLVAELWKKFLREGILDDEPRPEKLRDTKPIVDEINAFRRKAEQAPAHPVPFDNPDNMLVKRRVRGVRGGWKIFSDEILKSKPPRDGEDS